MSHILSHFHGCCCRKGVVLTGRQHVTILRLIGILIHMHDKRRQRGSTFKRVQPNGPQLIQRERDIHSERVLIMETPSSRLASCPLINSRLDVDDIQRVSQIVLLRIRPVLDCKWPEITHHPQSSYFLLFALLVNQISFSG